MGHQPMGPIDLESLIEMGKLRHGVLRESRDSPTTKLSRDSKRFCARWTIVITDVGGQRRFRLKSFYNCYLTPHPTDASIVFGRKVFWVIWAPTSNGSQSAKASTSD
ncbi:hypothetical protein MUK42_29504 [Musa troglodytarum]|uniref:Uncharacterized protein n=1 Tax=Musa troglodytarum TaxID=320322 RepID=A0A9E7FR61_9LILI|nr:hypothetical protein MUK42_29504 [Musa troglodytarum]